MLGHCERGVLSADWQDAVCCLAYFVLAEVKWTTTHAWALLSPQEPWASWACSAVPLSVCVTLLSLLTLFLAC